MQPRPSPPPATAPWPALSRIPLHPTLTSALLVLLPWPFVQSQSPVWLLVTPWTAACQTSLSLTISWSLPKFMSIESVMLSNYLIFCCPFLLPSVFSASVSFPVNQLFTSGGRSIGASASASVLPEYSGLIFFKIYWFDLLAVQGTLKSLLQHHSSKPSIIQHLAFL